MHSSTPPPRPRLALIAHDGRKPHMIELAARHRDLLSLCDLIGTGTTSAQIRERVGLPITPMLSGPQGGDQQIGAAAAEGRLDLVIFLRDPLSAQPHEPDIAALMRVCDVHHVALATNLSSAALALEALGSRLGLPPSPSTRS